MMRCAVLSLVLALATEANLAAQEATYTSSSKITVSTRGNRDPGRSKDALIVKNDDPTPEEFESTELRREKVVPGGQQVTVYIGPLKPGRYEFFGDFNPKTARVTSSLNR